MEAKLPRRTENHNRLVNQIADMNLEIKIFLEKFAAFRRTSNIIDNNLSHNLQSLVDNIDEYLDGDPTYIHTQDQTHVDINFDQNCLKRVVVCTVCEMEIGDRLKDISRHMKDPFHRNIIESGRNGFIRREENKVVAEINKKFEPKKKHAEKQTLPKKAKLFIAENFGLFVNKALKEGNIIKDMPIYGQLERALLSSISHEYSNAKMHLFGSRVSGLGTCYSDLDLFLDIDNVFNCYDEPRDNVIKKLRKVRQILEKQKTEWKNLLSIEDARVPILRAFNTTFKIECDIAFSNGLGSCNSRLMRYFFDLQPICHKMCIFLKKWMALTTLSYSKQISTYSIILMVVFYLQWQGILPSIAVLQRDVTVPLEVGPWMGNFAEKSLQDLNISRVGDDEDENDDDNDGILALHLKKFFMYYANLSFQNVIICPYLGKIIEKKNIASFKVEMPRYFQYYKMDPKNNALLLDKPMCVQDPFEQNHNVAKGINEGSLKLLRQVFLLSGQELNEKLLKISEAVV